MYRAIHILRTFLITAVIASAGSSMAAKASDSDLGLCPPGYDQGLVTTGFVNCSRRSGRRSTRQEAEADRLEREAICLANPNSIVLFSQIVGTSSGGFFSEIICQVSRPVPPGTELCPDDSAEVFRAFDTLVCEYFGSAATTAEDAQAMLDMQTTNCTASFAGRVLLSGIDMETAIGGEVDFFSTSLQCAKQIAPLDVFECPVNFNERDRSDTMLDCRAFDDSFETLSEAQAGNALIQEICTGTTAGLGTVSESLVQANTSGSGFSSSVDCEIKIPGFSDFADSETVRACDASCTESVIQTRVCINGGQLGGPGCTGSPSQTIERRCNTGPSPDSLCPLAVSTATVIPILLLDDEEE